MVYLMEEFCLISAREIKEIEDINQYYIELKAKYAVAPEYEKKEIENEIKSISEKRSQLISATRGRMEKCPECLIHQRFKYITDLLFRQQLPSNRYRFGNGLHEAVVTM